jgi:hypothetical protein
MPDAAQAAAVPGGRGVVMGVGATAIARNLGKEFLLNVADTIATCADGDGLLFTVRATGEQLCIYHAGLDRFAFQGRDLYGFQLRRAVESVIGQYDDIHNEVEEIFRDAREAARLESNWSWLAQQSEWAHKGRREFVEAERSANEGKSCACGCGRKLGRVSNPSRRRYATTECMRRADKAQRRLRRSSARQSAKDKLCACGCGQAIPRVGLWTRRKFVDDAHKRRAFYAANREDYHRRYLERAARAKA